ncbi:MAG: Omp28-related outer membrane protein [Candidatus Solibacter sp.]|nr:Omp28-related outer membrane protein [Candidatus Solibacter sp.]
MTARILTALCISFALCGANAQTTPPAAGDAAKPAVRETPPDQKAYTEAGKITDSVKKIAALEQLKKDFPDSSYASAADSQIFTTLIQKMPEQKDRIRKAAKAMFAEAVAKDKAASKENVIVTTATRGSTAQRIADQLLTGDSFLKEAESYARKGVEALRENIWIAEQREAYARRKQKIPPQEELAKRFAETRAARVATLGRVEMKLGRTAEAQKLLEESYAVTPSNVTVAAALGEMAAKSGNDAKAMDYLISTRLSGRAPDTANQAFETLYKKSHNGALDGLEAMLDTEYHKRFPNPVKVAAYQPTEKRSGRMVLAEVFTGSGCPPCAAADVAFDAAMERYTRKDLAVVMYHVHVPRPDPMTTTETTARSKNYGVTGVPTFAIDGKKTSGGGSRDAAPGVFERFQKDLEKDLETAAEAKVKIVAGLNGGIVRVSAAVDNVKSDSKDLKVQILLVEKEIRHLGENGIRFHPMVVRAFGGEKGEGYQIEANGNATFDASFDVEAIGKDIRKQLDEYEAKGHRGETFKFSAKKDQIGRGDLAVVVFVQDDKTKHVLQAGYVDLGTPAGSRPTTEVNQ